MKRTFIIPGLVFCSVALFAQDAREIMQMTYDKCQSVRNGYYEMTKYMKYMSHKDTTQSAYSCFYKKLKDDTLFSSAFHYKYIQDEYSGEVMYTGEEFVRNSARDSSGYIMSKSKWAKEINAIKHNFTFYSPLTNKESYPLQHGKDLNDKKHGYKFIGEENLNGAVCYHIQVNKKPENNKKDFSKTLRIAFDYWIKKEDSIPVQFTIEIDIAQGKDTLYQYEKFVLHKYELNNLQDEQMLTLNSIPSFVKLEDYVPYKRPELLPVDTIAPNWELLSVNDEKFSLHDLRGKLVLIDFFYKSCYPCILALPALQELHEKYQEKGLSIIGIDPYDTKEDDIAAFLDKRGVTYTVLLGGKDVAKTYRVSGYPTVYIIDRNGIIIYSTIGYGKGSEKQLEDIIKKHL